MQVFDFDLTFRLPDATADPEIYVEALGESGCTDALVGIGRIGMIGLDFSREASSAREAVLSAIEDVKAAIPDAELVEAKPDLVGLTEVAEILGFSRQYMRKVALGSTPAFPAPTHQGNPSMWHLAPVLEWLITSRRYAVDQTLVDLARLNMHLNIAIDEIRADRDEIDGLRALLA
ncbi:MAG: DNA-binding protein [Actinomycetota bacterium]|nr:MAG: DNA-binding [Actinomycetota bacterium]MDO8949828.1 DNA-binding protein [Actinomycetota bacterium]MDP3631078.1 DNA-binding protein [Actinomycetota bacterium]